MKVYVCHECGYEHHRTGDGKPVGIITHMINMTDEAHSQYNTHEDLPDYDSLLDREEKDVDLETPEIPDSDRKKTMSDTENCPNCDSDLEKTEAELNEYIEENGPVYCDQCFHELRVSA